MDTRSLKALSVLRLQGNSQGNHKETQSFPPETSMGTSVAIEISPAIDKRQQSLEASIDAIITETMDEIAKACNGKQFRSNDEIRKAEVEEAAIYKKVINVNAKLDEFKTAANKWKELSLIENSIKRN